MIFHFRNLTNGILCAPQDSRGNVRIGSTTCEQKQWDSVLRQAGVDMLALLAQGHSVVLHDQSERPRQTRAQWQGLSWIRYACARAWSIPAAEEFSRNGANVTVYWGEQYASLSKADLNYLRYFRPLVMKHPDPRPLNQINLRPCDDPHKPWEQVSSQVILASHREAP